MRFTPRHLILVNGLTVVACLLHVLVHALNVHVGEWHDYAVYALVAASFVASLMYGRQTQHEPLMA
jgi:hypothetical protein